MDEKSLMVDEEKAKAAIDLLSQTNKTLYGIITGDTFASLESIEKTGLITKTPAAIIVGLDGTYKLAKQEEDTLREATGYVENIDKQHEGSAGGIRNPGDSSGGGTPGGDKPEDNEPYNPAKPEKPITIPELTTEIIALPATGLNGFMNELQELAKKEKVTLDQLLTDPKYADLLKELFAKWNVSASLITTITGTENPGQFLKDLIDGKIGLIVKDEYLKTLKDKLEKIAKDNNITLDQLLTDSKYSDLLKTSLENILKANPDMASVINLVLKSSTMGTTLQSILNGTSTEVFTESEFNLIKEYLTKVAEANNITLDQLLTDPKYSELLNTSLGNIKGNIDILGALSGLSKEEAQKYLADLIAGKYPEAFGINSQTLDGVFDYLSNVASENNITVEQLLSDPQYSSLLQSELKNYSNSINSMQQQLAGKSTEEMQAWLRDAYNGATEGMDVNTIETVRNYIDSLAAQNNMTAEDVIMNSTNASIIEGGLTNSAKISVYLSNASTYQGTNTQSYLNSMYTGENYKAYGFTQTNVEQIKSSIDALAATQGITPEALMTKPEYSTMVQQKMGEIDTSNRLNQIYGDKPAANVQTVIKNLYNTKFETPTAAATTTE